MEENKHYVFSEEEWNACIKVLTVLKDAPFENPDNNLFAGLIVKIHKNAKKEIRQGKYTLKNEEDLHVNPNALNQAQLSSKKENFILRFLKRIK